MVGIGLLVLFASGAACGGDASPKAGTSTTAPVASSPTRPVTPEATATDSVEDQVLRAYATYWDVYADALRNRDPSHLAEVMTGPRLERGQAEIAELQSSGKAIALVIDSHPIVLALHDDEAVVSDRYGNASYYIDPTSKNALETTPATAETLHDTVTLQRVNGIWKVRDGVREEPGQ